MPEHAATAVRPTDDAAGRLVAIKAAWFDVRAERSRRRLWFASLLTLGVVVTDASGYFLRHGALRYGLALLPLAIVVLARGRHDPLLLRPLGRADRFVAALALYGLLGSLYGMVFGSATSPALTVFAPMPLALLHLSSAGPMGDAEAGRNLRRVAWLAGLYVVLHAGTSLGLLPDIGRGGPGSGPADVFPVFGHEKAYFVALALTSAWLTRRPLVLAALAVLAGVIFRSYPAGTYVVVGLVVVLTLVATGPRLGRRLAYLVGAMALGLVLVLYGQVTADGSTRRSSFVGSYFEAVDKVDNTETRAELWGRAVNRIESSPLVGSAFTGDISLKVKLSGRRYAVPPHNDFLQVGMGGGVPAMALLVGWIVAANVEVGRRCRRMAARRAERSVQLSRLLLVGFNSFFAVALLNPVMAKVGLGVVVMLLYALMMSIHGSGAGHAQAGGEASAA